MRMYKILVGIEDKSEEEKEADEGADHNIENFFYMKAVGEFGEKEGEEYCHRQNSPYLNKGESFGT